MSITSYLGIDVGSVTTKLAVVDENGKYDKKIGTCYFIRAKDGGWFGAYSNMFWWCELDVDNRWFNQLMEERH